MGAALVVMALSAAVLLWMPRHRRAIAVADVGTAAPDFQLRDLSGRLVKLSDFRGQAVVLYFGSLQYMRSADLRSAGLRSADLGTAGYNGRVHQLARRYAADERVQFLALNVTRPGEARVESEAVRRDAERTGRPFPTLLDDRGAVAARYSATPAEIPMVVVIDARGRVSYRGPIDDDRDIAFATRSYCAEALRELLGAPGASLAKSN
jgi:peroxiredoxin